MPVNVYGRELTPGEIAAGVHRDFVGGLWDEVGRLQFDFLRERGLAPHHRLLDVGCGALRGGVHFAAYLERGGYHGLDINASLLDAGRRELDAAGLADRDVHLLADDAFRARRFGTTFDVALAVSVFTHLPMNAIVRCLAEVRACLAPGGTFYATYFEAPQAAWLEPLEHPPGNIVTSYDCDPFHHAFDEIAAMARFAGLTASRIGDWRHPRGQVMVALEASSKAAA